MDNEELEIIVETDTCQTTRELSARFDVSMPSVLDHLKQIGKVTKLDQWVPHEMNEYQMIRHIQICCFLLLWHKSEPFLHCNT